MPTLSHPPPAPVPPRPANMKGLKSAGMVLCAKKGDTFELLRLVDAVLDSSPVPSTCLSILLLLSPPSSDSLPLFLLFPS